MKTSAAFPTALLTHALGVLPCLDSLGVTLQAELVRHINTARLPIGEMVEVNGKLFFAGHDQEHGTELWVSDGTEAGTGRVKDLNHGRASTRFDKLIDVNGTLYFTAWSQTNWSLWKSDGTPEGTVPVEIRPSSPRNILAESVVIDGAVLFATSDDTHGTELWKVRLGPWFEKLVLKDGQLTGEIFDSKGGRFQVQSSTDLRTWTDLTIVTHAGGAGPFSVPANAEPALFLRAVEIQR